MTRRIRQWWATGPWPNAGTKRKTFVLPALIIALGLIGTVVLGVRQANDRSDFALYKATVNEYIQQASDYTTCVTRSRSRDDISKAINGLYDFFEQLSLRFQAQDIADGIVVAQSEFNANFELVPIAQCGDPPKPPVGIDPAVVTTTTIPG